MLEAMEERHVTVDGISHELPYPFFLMATQNPVELAGTFPLPEAQMDRFLIQVALGYPQREEERQILHRFRNDNPLARVQPIVNAEDVRRAVTICRNVFVHPVLEDYLLDLVEATREENALGPGRKPARQPRILPHDSGLRRHSREGRSLRRTTSNSLPFLFCATG